MWRAPPLRLLSVFGSNRDSEKTKSLLRLPHVVEKEKFVFR